MKKTVLLFGLLIFQNFSHAQLISYTIDSVSFGALDLDGGDVEVEFADINQDGSLDIITIGDHGSPNINTNQHGITVFFGNGSGGNWTLFQNGDFGYGGIAVGDLNNDRYEDAAYGMHHNYSSTDFGDQFIEAALGDGTGMSWTPWDDSLATNGESYGMMGTDLGDMDNDGFLDIASNSFGCCAGTHVYRNQGTGVWNQTFGFVNGNTMRYLKFGDLNHDGNLDLVVSNQYGTAYMGDGTGQFIPKQAGLPAQGNLGYWDVSLGDIDNDGDDDFAFVSNGTPMVYKWNDSLQQWTNCSSGLSGMDTYCARLADLNMDGFMDMVTVEAAGLKVWTGNGGLSWSNSLSYPLPDISTCQDVTVGDIDHNGYPDVLTWADYYVSWFSSINKLKLFRENTIAGSLDLTLTYPKGYECFPNLAARFIRWACAVPGNNPSSVGIELSTTGPSGPWTTVEAAAPNNGKYQWQAPAAVVSADCFFRIIVTDSITSLKDTSVNQNPFQIGVCNPVTGIQPNTAQAAGPVALPNPFQEKCTVYSGLANCTMVITDINGRTVSNYSPIEQFPYTIEKGGMKPGIYLALLKKNGAIRERLKLVVY